MKVFIVENSLSVRNSIQSVLSDMPEVKVIGHAMNETVACERIGVLLPDVVILSLGLQSGSGISVLEHVKELYSHIKVIVLTHFADAEYIERCKHAGAEYFFDKTNQLMQLREILLLWARTVGKGIAPVAE